jgi:hypothetical protein
MNMNPRPLLLTLVLATLGHASTIFLLDRDACTGTCGTAPFATVTLEQTTANTISVTEILAGSDVFAGTGAGQALAFILTVPVTIGAVTPGFDVGPSPASASAFGNFLLSVTCTVCQGGKLSNPSRLAFTVTAAQAISAADFLANDRGYAFASDIRGRNGETGNVAVLRSAFITPDPDPAASISDAVPEPATFLLAGAGLAGLGLFRRRPER